MNTKSPVYVLAVFLIVSCMDFTREHYVTYKARIADYSQLAEAEARVRNIGARWNLGIYQKRFNHSPSRRYEPSLFMLLSFDDYTVLGVSYWGYGFRLTATDGSGMPLEDLERLLQEVKSELEALGLEFELQGSS